MPELNPWYKNSYALLIGIDHYADPQFIPLGKAEQDAVDIAEVLGAVPYCFQVRTLLSAEATRQNILDALYTYYRTEPDDRVLVYFSGHGYTLTNRFGHETGYFACYDTAPERHYTALRMDEVTGLREQANAKHIAFIFDACFSGQALGLAKATPGAADQFLVRRAYQVISAGAPDQAVQDYHSMTQYLLPVLRHPTETLTLETLGVYLKQTMADASRGMQIPQHGQITGSQGGDFIFLECAASALPDWVLSAAASEDSSQRLVAANKLREMAVDASQTERAEQALARLEELAQDRDPVVRALVEAVLREIVPEPEPVPQVREEPIPIPPAVVEKETIALPEPKPEKTASVYYEPAPPVAPSTAPAPRARKDRLPWKWIGAAAAAIVVIVIGLLALSSLLGSQPNSPSSGNESGSTSNVTVEGGVIHNADWTPHIETIHGVEMVLVPAGCFPMGTNDGDPGERPVHMVCFEEPFWIDVYEVTNGQYGEIAADCQDSSSDENEPRVCINWTDAQMYCEYRDARLPTEAEWEYAARGPDGLEYPWGDSFVEENVVYTYTSNIFGEADPVGSRPGGVSWVGAYDLSGNVEEWVNDSYDPDYYRTLIDGVVNPQGPTTSGNGVTRGGSVGTTQPTALRSAIRQPGSFSNEYSFLGFRCALSFEQHPIAPTESTQEPTPTVSSNTALSPRDLSVAGVSANADWTPYTEEINGVEMALVPAGCFPMGSEDDEEHERPVHEVCFEEPFWIDVYEVTNEAFGSTGCEESSSEPDQPRNCVNWTDSLAHCEARGARLPTEAEWEYAARGPDGLVYPWGNEFDCHKGNFDDETAIDSEVVPGGTDCDGFDVTSPVGSLPGDRSWVGAFDLSGNVRERVHDWYDGSYYGTLADGAVNPQGPNSGEGRVLRGGGWKVLLVSRLRGANRFGVAPDDSTNAQFGFRCALSYQP